MDYYINNNDEKCCDSKHKGGVKMIGYGGDERSPNHPKKCPNEREREREREAEILVRQKGCERSRKWKRKRKRKCKAWKRRRSSKKCWELSNEQRAMVVVASESVQLRLRWQNIINHFGNGAV